MLKVPTEETVPSPSRSRHTAPSPSTGSQTSKVRMWSEGNDQSSTGSCSGLAEGPVPDLPARKVIGMRELKTIVRVTFTHIIGMKIPDVSGVNFSVSALPRPCLMFQTTDDLPRPQKRRRLHMAEHDAQSQSETWDTECKEVHLEEKVFFSSGACSSSYHSSLPCRYPLMTRSTGEDFAGIELSSLAQNPHTACSYSGATAFGQSVQGPQRRSGEVLIPSEAMLCIDPLPNSEVDVKINELVRYLLCKYVRKEPATKAEMTNVIGIYQGYYQMFLHEASECLLLIFGIDVKEVVSYDHTYVLVTALNLRYDGMLSEIQGIPKTGLLIMVLCIIFMEHNHAREEVVWRVLGNMGLFAERDHFMYGRPRKLITEDFVQEGYLEYRHVPHSDPARYEFLWGPRAHAETSEMKVLEFFIKVTGYDPRSHPMWNTYIGFERGERGGPGHSCHAESNF